MNVCRLPACVTNKNWETLGFFLFSQTHGGSPTDTQHNLGHITMTFSKQTEENEAELTKLNHLSVYQDKQLHTTGQPLLFDKGLPTRLGHAAKYPNILSPITEKSIFKDLYHYFP